METESLLIEGLTFIVFHHSEEGVQVLNEAKLKGRSLVGNYSYDIHKPHNPTGEYHMHLYDKSKEILAINKVSGTAHDGFHGARIPNKAFNALKQKYSDWKWPNNQILESVDSTYFITNSIRNNVRPVRVFQNFNDIYSKSYDGYFHCFADDPFSCGGGQGFISKTVALIEKEDGHIEKVALDGFKFIV